jgi:hypothetical protein
MNMLPNVPVFVTAELKRKRLAGMRGLWCSGSASRSRERPSTSPCVSPERDRCHQPDKSAGIPGVFSYTIRFQPNKFKEKPMKNTLLAVLAVCIALGLAENASAQSYTNFEGHWRNNSAQLGELIQLDITIRGPNVDVKAWGNCQPNPCDLGRTEAHIYADGRNSSPQTSARALLVTYVQSFSMKTLVIEPRAPSHIYVSMFTHFTDNSGRTDYVENSLFTR